MVALLLFFTLVANLDLPLVYLSSAVILVVFTCEQKHSTNTAKAVLRPLKSVGHMCSSLFYA